MWPVIGVGQAVLHLELEALLMLEGERECLCGTRGDFQVRVLRAH